MRRTITTLFLTLVNLAVLAQAALAESDVGHDGGEGWWGETNDKVVTNAGFILIAGFPTLILILSLVQWRLEKRKQGKLAAARSRKSRVDVRGGW
jgi:hypothetical protein